jgi:hypothetical protein
VAGPCHHLYEPLGLAAEQLLASPGLAVLGIREFSYLCVRYWGCQWV